VLRKMEVLEDVEVVQEGRCALQRVGFREGRVF
jgi:hypothetical protein